MRDRTPAHEAQRLFFDIGMVQRGVVGAELARLGLTFNHAHTLRVLERPTTMGELAEELACDASNVTGIADRLEARGLLERRPGPGDRRVKLLALTPAGRRMRQQVLELMAEPPAALVALDAADQRALVEILGRAAAGLELSSRRATR